MAGIVELKEVVTTIVGLGNATGKALEDGNITVADIPLFITPLLSIPEALENIESVPGELKDLEAAEKAELMAYVQTELDIPQEKVELVCEAAFGVVLELATLVALLQPASGLEVDG